MLFSSSQKSKMSLLVFLASGLGNAGGTMYLPALIAMSSSLHIAKETAQLSMSIYLISISLSQIFYGPLSDAFGRRINLLVGVALFIIGSLCCSLADSALLLISGRIIQGLGIGAANTVGFGLLRDLYSGNALVKQLCSLSLFVGIMPIVAPIIGGYLVTYISWRACFLALGLFGIILLILKIALLYETNLSPNTQAYKPKIVINNFMKLIKDKIFLGYVLSASMAFAILLTFNTMLPFVLIQDLNISPDVYGWLTIFTGLGYISGAYFGGKVSESLGLYRSLLTCVLIAALSSILGLILAFINLSVASVLIPLIFLLVGVGMNIPLASGGAMKRFPEIAGSAGALLAICMFLCASLFTFISSKTTNQYPWTMFSILLIMSVINFLITSTIKKDGESHV